MAAVNVQTALRTETASNDQGYYVFPSLMPGAYELEVTKAGFNQLKRTGIVVETGRISTVDADLTVGDVKQSMTVEADAPQLESETSSIASVIEARSIQNLPLINRQGSQLVRMNGFVVQNGTGSSQFSIAGGRGDNAMWLLDGNNAQNLPNIGVASLAYDPPVESLQEFNVAVSNYAAELGRSGGGVIQMTTKSGTNEFHGSAYEYFRNDVLNARTFFSSKKPTLRYNLFGTSLGGPIIKNRTFFFFNYEGTRLIQGTAQVLGVPTVAEEGGNFSADAKPLLDPVTKAPFTGNVIPASRLDPVGLKIAALYPAPNVPGQASGNANFNANQRVQQSPNNYIGRVDHAFNERNRMFGRFNARTDDNVTGAVFTMKAADPSASVVTQTYYNLTGTYYHDFSGTLLNEFRAGFDRRYTHTQSSGAYSNLDAQLGLAGANQAFGPQVVVPGFTNIGTATQERYQKPTLSIPIADHLSWIHGSHRFKFGAEYRYAEDLDLFPGLAGGSLSFNTVGTNYSLANVLLGRPVSGQVLQIEPTAPRGDNYNAFVQDNWKVTPKLTLNLGLRWDIDQPRYEQNDNRQNSFDRTEINPVSGTPGAVTFSGRNGVSKYASNWDLNNFGPRLGFAWALPHEWVVRGGAGLVYVGAYDMATPLVANLGFSRNGLFVSPDNGVTPAFPLSSGFPPSSFPAEADLTAGFGAVPVGKKPTSLVSFFEPQRGTGYLEQFNFNIQKQLRWNSLFEVGYLATLGHGLPVSSQSGVTINQVPTALLGPGNAQINRPFPQYSDVRVLAAEIGNSNYHGLNVRFEKRTSNGLSFNANYTWSRSIDDVPGRNELGTPSAYNTYLNIYDRAGDRGLSGNDIKHRVVLSAIYQLPVGQGKQFNPSNFLLRQAFGGWSLGYISEIRSGAPYGVLEAVNLTNSFSDGNRPNVVGDPNISGDRTRGQKVAEWFNVNAFAAPAPYTFGNAGRTAGYGPGAVSMDLSLLKDFVLHERHDIQFRAEALNLLNTPSFALPEVRQGNPNFGRITSLVPGNQARVIQVCVHYQF